MGLHEYKVKAGRLGTVETVLLLSDEDAAAQGLTKKDRVSSSDQTVQPNNPEFQPRTEAELNPNAAADELARVQLARSQAEQAAEDARVALEAAQAEEARVIEQQEADAKNAAEAQAAAEKEQAAAKNKQAPRSANKSAAQTPAK